MTPETAMKQAGYTANEYLMAAIESIDKQFGPGYAKENPELVGAFIQACAMDFQTAASLGLIDI